jgi:NitT/TauT family transport system substrate-binding protein
MRRLLGAALGLAAALLAVRPAAAAEAVRFGTDWKAEAEHGGYYQALATGIYKKYGLDVTLRQGGPQVNHAQLLAAGALDFNIASNSFLPLNYVNEKVPMVAVAAIFQKDPAVLITHPGRGEDNFAELKGKPIMIGADARVGWWRFLAAKYGYTDSQIRPYTFNLAPFFADPEAIQEGYASSEPYLIRQKTGVEPVVLPLSAAGYEGYANIIETSDKLVSDRPDIVQRFVDASIEGWYSYLHGDPGPADRLIMRANPEMPADLLAFGRKTLIDRGIVDSGDAKTLGIGAMTDARWQAFYRSMVAVGVYPAGVDLKQAYTTRFVDKRVGMEAER